MSLLVNTLGMKKYLLNEEELLHWLKLSPFILVMTKTDTSLGEILASEIFTSVVITFNGSSSLFKV